MKNVWILALVLVGCFGPMPKKKPKPEFDAAEYAAYVEPGTSVIMGQAFLKTRGGDVKLGAGNPLFLNPATSYSTELFYDKPIKLGDMPDPQAAQYTRRTIADGQGKFNFEGLPAGQYFVSCYIRWSTGDSSYSGGTARVPVTIGEGETLDNVLVHISYYKR